MARHAVDKCPLFVFDAPTPGSGKTLLAELGGLMVTGRHLALMCPSDDDEENRKRITTMMLDSVPACLIDNVVGNFGGAAFDAALTAPEWTDRILGASRRVTMPNTMTWAASGNNMTIKGDMGRRVIICRVDAQTESPDKRVFARTEAELVETVTAKRREYLEALVTILRFGVVSDTIKLPQWGSFERWSQLVRKPIVALGLPDPETAREAFRRDSDVERETRVALLRAVRRMTLTQGECTARTMLQVCDEEMKELAAELAHCSPKALTSSKLGVVFKKMNGRSFDGLALSSRLDRLNVKLWSVTNEGSDE
jgi:putative DNA primase/helicase